MNSFLELAKARYSVRNYQPKPVEKEKLMIVLEAGRIAPSAANYQPWHFIVIQDPAIRKKLDATYNRSWFSQAPVVIVICGDHKEAWKRGDGKDHTDIDASIAIDHMTLAAAEIGLGTCWICNFDAKMASEVLQLPENIEPIAYLPLGYPGGDKIHPCHTDRKPLGKIVHWDKF
jgi:nitroreductase